MINVVVVFSLMALCAAIVLGVMIKWTLGLVRQVVERPVVPLVFPETACVTSRPV